MLGSIISKLTIFALNSKRLSGDQRTAVMNEALKNISLLPSKDVIKFDMEGTLMVRGKKLDFETAKMFKESCMVLQDNFARKIFEEQTAYEAIKLGIHNGLNTEMIQFSKAILWWNEQQNKLISLVLGE